MAIENSSDPSLMPSGSSLHVNLAGKRLNNLPLQLTSFVGREREIVEVERLLFDSRLVTLTGTGGSGKTRLAIQVATGVVDSFADGAWLVELAGLADERLVPQAVAQVLDVHEATEQALSDTLAHALRSKQLLLLIDNCEHLIAACALLVEQLLRACPDVKILTTSREPLGIGGEAVYQVPTLSLPDLQSASPKRLLESEAGRLFVERARSAKPSFALNEQNARGVAQICRRLEGIPLAIELAAARVKLLSVEKIATRLDDRFSLLTMGSRTALPRQQTLRATIDWSYNLLPEDVRLLFRRLSVFGGGFTLEAAEQICSAEPLAPRAVLDILSRLVDRSLVVVDSARAPERYRMLDTIREYAREQLAESGEAVSVRRRHAEFFTTWVEQMDMELRAGPTQLDRFAQLETEHDNIAVALEWSLSSADPELGLRLVGVIFYFWWRCGHWLEWTRWMSLASVYLDEVSEKTRAGMLIAMAGIEFLVKHDNEGVRYHSREALEIYSRLGDRRNAAWAIIWLSTCMPWVEEEYSEYMNLTEEAIAMLRQEGELGSVGQGLTNLGLNAQGHGDLVRAKQAFSESLEIARATGDRLRAAVQYSNLSNIALAEGDFEAAAVLAKQSMSWGREHGNAALDLDTLVTVSGILALRGQPRQAAQIIGTIDMLSDRTEVKLQQWEQHDYDRYVALLRRQLGTTAFETLRNQGRGMTQEQAIEYALEATGPVALTGKAPTSRQAVKQEFGGLTEREREVAGLISQGKSNREIAKLLVVTERTVEKHVENILSKLGFASRTQIATWAVEKGLARSGS